MVKNGKTKSGSQRYVCRVYGKIRVKNYAYEAYKADTRQNIIQLTKEGLGIRCEASMLKISATTLLKRIISIVSKGKTYEVDEPCMCIRYKKNYIWLVYALEKKSKNVVSFNVGKRTKKNK
ncbi:hypothetical protein ABXT06_22355 [Flavobacterium sp. UW10123]|uniref:hypothetical protein n=1 Tax=Flavobacterium sp. UW10123 TaxID=3230800 RepID=UPI003395312B